MDKKRILDNRLEFIAHHRNNRETLQGAELFHSDVDFFKTAFLFNEIGIENVPSAFELYIPEWIPVKNTKLEKHGWQQTDSMIHMVLKKGREKWQVNPAINITRIRNESQLEEFCQTQSRGFNGEHIADDPMYPAMLASCRKNLQSSNHHFYLASLKNKPAGAIVLFFHDGGLGIYSVTTVEKFRRHGVSTTLMNKALEEAKKEKSTFITLQTMAGTYAESFYEKLGFIPVFESKVYKQPGK